MPDKAKTGTEPKLEYVSPDKLLFDPENPRFAGSLAGKNQQQIQEAIFQEPHYASELVDSFLENGFIDYEPLVVRREGDKFIVVEGNRRLSAVKHILANVEQYADRDARISDLQEIPVLVFPEGADDQQNNEMRVYLGVRHLLGVRDWPPRSKAKYLDNESKRPGGLDLVIKETRLTKQQVRRFLVPYRLLLEAKLDLPQDEDFWMIGEALGRTGVKQFLQLDVDSDTLAIHGFDKRNLQLLLDDLYGPKKHGGRQRDAGARKVHDTRELSTYASVLSSDKALALLRKGKTLADAAIYVETKGDSAKRLLSLLKQLPLLVDRVFAKNKPAEAERLRTECKALESTVKNYLKTNA
jgi:hypothetical protein